MSNMLYAPEKDGSARGTASSACPLAPESADIAGKAGEKSTCPIWRNR
jgi:hypothetical protein